LRIKVQPVTGIIHTVVDTGAWLGRYGNLIYEVTVCTAHPHRSYTWRSESVGRIYYTKLYG